MNQLIIENVKKAGSKVTEYLDIMYYFYRDNSIIINIAIIWFLIGTIVWWKMEYSMRLSINGKGSHRYSGLWTEKEHITLWAKLTSVTFYDYPVSYEEKGKVIIRGWDTRLRWWYATLTWPYRLLSYFFL